MPPIALLRFPDFVYAAWSAAQNRPLRQQMLPLSATGGGRICCPSEGAFDGQPQGLSLRALVYFYAISAENYHISIWFYQKHNKKRSRKVSVFNLI